MRRISTALLSVSLAAPALADVDAALNDHILPGYARFAEATKDLAQAAATDCDAEALAPVFHAAFDAWMPVADIRLGPSETGALSIAFWPDARGFTPRTLARLIAEDGRVTALVPEAAFFNAPKHPGDAVGLTWDDHVLHRLTA